MSIRVISGHEYLDVIIEKEVRVLMGNNIISFEEYREKKLGRKYEESPLNELFRKDLREQKDLLD